MNIIITIITSTSSLSYLKAISLLGEYKEIYRVISFLYAGDGQNNGNILKFKKKSFF